MDQVQIISSSESIQAMTQAEVDVQVQTAMRYPKHSTPDQIAYALTKAEAFALVDSETAESCFYRLEREGKNGQKSIIEGPSIRLAEIIANSWGNLRIATRIVANDGKFITAQGGCHDLETNVQQVVEIKRSITTSKGFTFSADMQVVTGNAAAAIARRNAILAVIPQAVFKPLYAKIQQRVLGEVQNNLETRRAKMFKTYALLGVTQQMLFQFLNVQAVEDITAEMVVNLGKTYNALLDGSTTVEEVFKKPAAEAAAAQKVREKNAAAKDRIAASAAGARAKTSTAPVPAEEDLPPAPGEIDPETGEVYQQQ